jgi:hypothetical protein
VGAGGGDFGGLITLAYTIGERVPAEVPSPFFWSSVVGFTYLTKEQVATGCSMRFFKMSEAASEENDDAKKTV